MTQSAHQSLLVSKIRPALRITPPFEKKQATNAISVTPSIRKSPLVLVSIRKAGGRRWGWAPDLASNLHIPRSRSHYLHTQGQRRAAYASFLLLFTRYTPPPSHQERRSSVLTLGGSCLGFTKRRSRGRGAGDLFSFHRLFFLFGMRFSFHTGPQDFTTYHEMGAIKSIGILEIAETMVFLYLSRPTVREGGGCENEKMWERGGENPSRGPGT